MNRLIFLLALTITWCGSTSFVIPETKKQEKPVHHPRNIILMIGDGMGLAQIYASYTVNFGSLNVFKMPVTGISRTSSANKYITDSAAGGTAISSGQKTKNGMIGTDSTGKAIQSILEIAEANKLSTGMVVTCAVTHATPASFIAHCPDRDLYEDIALDFLRTDIDLFFGGGYKYFKNRKDGRDLTVELQKKGYSFISKDSDIAKCMSTPVAALVADDETLPISKGRGTFLPDATQNAIRLLNKNNTGFFLMVEGSQIDWGGHANDIQYVVNEMLDFDKAVGRAIEFAKNDGNTLVIVTADHETGGLVIMDGDIKNGEVQAKYNTNYHTGVPVMVFAYGPDSEQFTGCYENTEIFYKMMNSFGFDSKTK